MRFKELSDEQRKGWYIAGTIYGACILFVGYQAGALTGVVEWLTFGLAWVAGLALLRLYIQDKDPTNFLDILGLRKKKQALHWPRPARSSLLSKPVDQPGSGHH